MLCFVHTVLGISIIFFYCLSVTTSTVHWILSNLQISGFVCGEFETMLIDVIIILIKVVNKLFFNRVCES